MNKREVIGNILFFIGVITASVGIVIGMELGIAGKTIFIGAALIIVSVHILFDNNQELIIENKSLKANVINMTERMEIFENCLDIELYEQKVAELEEIKKRGGGGGGAGGSSNRYGAATIGVPKGSNNGE